MLTFACFASAKVQTLTPEEFFFFFVECQAKLTESVAANVVALAHHTFNAVEKLTECIVRGSRRARSNAAVCVCHITARRHAVSVKV